MVSSSREADNCERFDGKQCFVRGNSDSNLLDSTVKRSSKALIYSSDWPRSRSRQQEPSLSDYCWGGENERFHITNPAVECGRFEELTKGVVGASFAFLVRTSGTCSGSCSRIVNFGRVLSTTGVTKTSIPSWPDSAVSACIRNTNGLVIIL